ncbi:hypothetical protein LSH36_915g00055, partial [Paralvinella palmiformis]
MLCSSDIYILINYASFVESVFIGVSIVALIYLRWKQPKLDRPIKVNLFFPVFFLGIMGFLIIFPLFTNASECLFGLMMIATGVPVYLIAIAWKKKPRSFVELT